MSCPIDNGNYQNGVASEKACMLDNRSNVGIGITAQRYYLARQNLLQMLTDRGYNVPLSQSQLSIAQFKALFGNNPDPDTLKLSFHHTSTSSKKILVIFLGPEEIRVRRIRGICGQITEKESLHTLLLVTQSSMTSMVRKVLDKYSFRAEIFKIQDLFVNVTKHILMPKHEILTAGEKDELLNKYKLENKEFPTMLATDAVSRYYGMEKGQVIKLTYEDGIVDGLVTYRCVM